MAATVVCCFKNMFSAVSKNIFMSCDCIEINTICSAGRIVLNQIMRNTIDDHGTISVSFHVPIVRERIRLSDCIIVACFFYNIFFGFCVLGDHTTRDVNITCGFPFKITFAVRSNGDSIITIQVPFPVFGKIKLNTVPAIVTNMPVSRVIPDLLNGKTFSRKRHGVIALIPLICGSGAIFSICGSKSGIRL